nr:hypothetical protein CFP56_22108 [Quercus suber]
MWFFLSTGGQICDTAMGLLVVKDDDRLHSICVTMPWKVRIVRDTRMAEKGRAVSDPVRRPGDGTRICRSPNVHFSLSDF